MQINYVQRNGRNARFDASVAVILRRHVGDSGTAPIARAQCTAAPNRTSGFAKINIPMLALTALGRQTMHRVRSK